MHTVNEVLTSTLCCLKDEDRLLSLFTYGILVDRSGIDLHEYRSHGYDARVLLIDSSRQQAAQYKDMLYSFSVSCIKFSTPTSISRED